MKDRIIIFCLFISCSAQALPNHESRLNPLQVLTEIPSTGLRTLQVSFSKEAILPWSVVAVSTAGLYLYDQEMLDEVQRWGRSTGIGNADNTKSVAKAGDIPLLRLPSDTGSALYFLGDGWVHFGIAGSFLLSGQFAGGNRAHNTGLQIVHGMIVSTIFSQVLKRSTGRESPSESVKDRGEWRPFPSVAAYGRNTAKYDAFPSGHVMTATLTFTIINENYPEYSHVTLPVAGTWITLLGLQMMNNGVHWASDYPLAIAMGYVIGRASTRLGQDQTIKSSIPESARSLVFPSVYAGTQTLNLLRTF